MPRPHKKKYDFEHVPCALCGNSIHVGTFRASKVFKDTEFYTDPMHTKKTIIKAGQYVCWVHDVSDKVPAKESSL